MREKYNVVALIDELGDGIDVGRFWDEREPIVQEVSVCEGSIT